MRHLSDKEDLKNAEVKNKIRILKRVEESQIIFSGGEQTKVVAMAAFGIDVCFVVIDIERSFTNIRRFSFKNKIAKSDSALMEEFISRLVLAIHR